MRPVEQGEGDSFVVAFARASDAVACALDLQRAPLAPIRLRIGVHTGEVQLRDEGNYVGPTINRTARLRDLAHGGQTVLSGATEEMVVDQLPDGAWLTDLGTPPAAGPPPARAGVAAVPSRPAQRLPTAAHGQHRCRAQSSGAADELRRPRKRRSTRSARALCTDNRLVTLTGAGGAGKTRLAIEVAAQMAGRVPRRRLLCRSGADHRSRRGAGRRWPARWACPTSPAARSMDTLLRFVRDRQMLLVLDNCEHLLDASAALVVDLLGRLPEGDGAGDQP